MSKAHGKNIGAAVNCDLYVPPGNKDTEEKA